MMKNWNLSRKWLFLAFLVLLLCAALIQFHVTGLARRTFVFYAANSGFPAIEERMLGNSKYPSGSRERDIIQYVEEALLGPASPNSLPLFPRGTRLQSLLYREGIVYADISNEAALPLLEGSSETGGDVFTSLQTLYNGIKRNFSFVREIRFFIAGKAAYTDKFR